MIDLIVAGASYLFPVGRALKLIKAGVKVTNSTNPLNHMMFYHTFLFQVNVHVDFRVIPKMDG